MTITKNTSLVSRILNTPYNWSLIIATGLIFAVFYCAPFSSNGYDRYTNWFNYITLFSIGGLLARYIRKESNHKDKVGQYGAFNLILSMVTLLLTKSLSLGMLILYIQTYFLLPLSIFTFLLLIKEILINIEAS